MISPKEVGNVVRELRQKYAQRDQNMLDIQHIRNGHLEDVAPDMFSEDIPKAIVQNFIDIAARTTAEMLAPMPSFNCSASNMASDAARKFADKKTKGIQHYYHVSGVQSQMYSSADYFVSYGLMPHMVEPDFRRKTPRIVGLNPIGCYPEKNRWGDLISFTRVIRKSVMDLCNLYPELERHICGSWQSPNSQAILDVSIYHDKDQWLMQIPERHDLILNFSPNFINEMCVSIAERPGVTDIPRGQFDDVTWIQLARNRFAMMAMEAAEQAVEAPMAVPYDVQEFSIGPLSTIRTNSPEKVRRVGMEMSPAAFQEGQILQQELQQGSRFPESLTGTVDASIVTGQGIKALQGGFNSSIQAAQEIFTQHFAKTTEICLRMDEALWPSEERDIRGNADGVPYTIKWRPERDIKQDYSCDVTYGFAMGLDPNRALVALLQMRGDRLISRDFTRRQFPFGINVTEEEATIEVEELRTALLQSIAALAQSIPVLAQQGGDPGQILAQLGSVIKQRQKGKPLEDAVTEAFAPPEPTPEEQALMEEQGMGGGLPPGPIDPAMAGGANPMPPGPPGGGGMDIMSMLAGLNGGSGNPTSTVNVKRQLPI